MEINQTKKVKVVARSMHLHMKVRDQFECQIKDEQGDIIRDYEGYVPSFMPGQHFGDYLILDIDLDTGQVLNWKEVNKSQLKDFIENGEGEDD
jgi:hypothetical protein